MDYAKFYTTNCKFYTSINLTYPIFEVEKPNLGKLINISFSILLLLSTVGVTVDNHYCAGSYVGTWLYAKDNACGMDMPDNDNCCHDDITVYSVQNEFQFISSKVSPELQLIAYVTLTTNEEHKALEDQYSNSFYWYSYLSPPTAPKIYIKVQSFLIWWFINFRQ